MWLQGEKIQGRYVVLKDFPIDVNMLQVGENRVEINNLDVITFFTDISETRSGEKAQS